MPYHVFSPIERWLTRLIGLWVKPDVLPEMPAELLNPNLPILYVLEVGGIADHSALRLVCRKHGLSSPDAQLSYGSARERGSVVSLKQRQGLIFRRHRHQLSAQLLRIIIAGLGGNSGRRGADDDQPPDDALNFPGELQIVPVAIYWGRAPERPVSAWRLLFVENWQIAGRSRKFFTTLFHGRNTLVRFSEPLSLRTFLEDNSAPEILRRKLSRILRVHFRQRRIASLGPDQSHRRMLIDHVLADTRVREAISADAENSSKSHARIAEQARRYAYEIAADVSYPTVRILHRLLTRLWNELYDGVQTDGVERLEAVADGREIVYVPCHRSHIDYLLLSYILYMHGFSLPHIAAGINLNLPFVGGLLRRGGAFFLRRTFAGNVLYATVFSAYLQEILQRGHALEYFIEGGRSRTGRLLPPKAGMLSMTCQAYLRDRRTPVVFVPIYIGYERLLEGRAFISELAGGKKQKESLFALFKSLRTLREDYGTVYVNFGEPIELDSLLNQHQPDWRSTDSTEERPTWLNPIVSDLGNTIMQRINSAASVTPISLMATALLASPRGQLGQDELLGQIAVYHQLLKRMSAGSAVMVPDIDPQSAVRQGIRLDFIDVHNDQIGSLIALKAGQTAPVTYFRNNIQHLLAMPALIACCFNNARTRTITAIYRQVFQAYPFLQAEFYIGDELSETTIDQTLAALAECGLLSRVSAEEGHSEVLWRRPALGANEGITLLRLAHSVTPSLERYYLVCGLLVMANERGISHGELSDAAAAAANRLSQTHEYTYGDLYDKYLLQQFLQTLTSHGYIQELEERLHANSSLNTVEADARILLSEHSRQAILNTVIALSPPAT